MLWRGHFGRSVLFRSRGMFPPSNHTPPRLEGDGRSDLFAGAEDQPRDPRTGGLEEAFEKRRPSSDSWSASRRAPRFRLPSRAASCAALVAAVCLLVVLAAGLPSTTGTPTDQVRPRIDPLRSGGGAAELLPPLDRREIGPRERPRGRSHVRQPRRARPPSAPATPRRSSALPPAMPRRQQLVPAAPRHAPQPSPAPSLPAPVPPGGLPEFL